MRFSNGKNFAITFESSDVNEFLDQSISALKRFRIQTEKRIHKGEIKKTVSWFENPELHVYSETLQVWQDMSIIKGAYRETFKIHFTNQADNIDEIFVIDKNLLEKNITIFWLGCVDSNNWADALNLQITNLGDMLCGNHE
jgi:hypothetical protein